MGNHPDNMHSILKKSYAKGGIRCIIHKCGINHAQSYVK